MLAFVSIVGVLYQFITIFGTVLTWAIIIRALLSWFNLGGGTYRLVGLLVEITEPILAPIRRILPGGGMLDFSPIIALLLIQVIQQVLISTVVQL